MQGRTIIFAAYFQDTEAWKYHIEYRDGKSKRNLCFDYILLQYLFS